MIKFLARRAANAMERKYNYDSTYLREVADVSRGGALRLSLLSLLSGYDKGAPVDLWAGAAVASTREGDCGPCLQLVIDMALEKGANPGCLRAALQQDFDAARLTGLGFRFAQAAIADGSELDSLREEIIGQYGEQAVISLSITAATSRSWPVVKRGLGHGRACQAVEIDNTKIELITAG